MTLYNISKLLTEALDAAEVYIDYETGEIAPEWGNYLDNLQLERNEKILSIARCIKNIMAEANAIKIEKERLQRRQYICEKKAERMKTWLATFMNPGEKISDETCKLTWRKSERTIVDMPASYLPKEYVKIEYIPVLIKIKEDLKTGKDIPGCRIETKNNLIIT